MQCMSLVCFVSVVWVFNVKKNGWLQVAISIFNCLQHLHLGIFKLCVSSLSHILKEEGTFSTSSKLTHHIIFPIIVLYIWLLVHGWGVGWVGDPIRANRDAGFLSDYIRYRVSYLVYDVIIGLWKGSTGSLSELYLEKYEIIKLILLLVLYFNYSGSIVSKLST